MVLQVRLHGVTAAAQRILVALRRPAEPGVQFQRGPVGGVRDLPGHRHPGQRRLTVVIVAAAEVAVGPDGRELRHAPGDLVAGEVRAGGDGDGPGHPVRVADRPFQRPHAAHRPAEHGGELLDAEPVGQRRLGGHLIAHGDPRETGTRTADRPGRSTTGRWCPGSRRARSRRRRRTGRCPPAHPARSGRPTSRASAGPGRPGRPRASRRSARAAPARRCPARVQRAPGLVGHGHRFQPLHRTRSTSAPMSSVPPGVDRSAGRPPGAGGRPGSVSTPEPPSDRSLSLGGA